MTKLPQKWLFDIVRYGTRVREYLGDVPNYLSYEADTKTQLAIERCLEVIGEACYKLRKYHQLILSYSDRAYNFRGSLIHQYDEIKPQTIFQFATQHLPILVREAQEKLREIEQ